VIRIPSNIATLTAAQRQDVSEALELARLVEFAGDVAQLADRRLDLDLRALVDDLHADLTRTEGGPMTDPTDADRLKLLDRIAERVPELDLAQHSVDWMTLADGHECAAR